ncbi:MAG: hypothetical protein A2X18_04195 [Bacteroidetes bacterium GWF2_40_14]|nr:MAG: hypothetical protein A2X18_04195 [Bacteroidetes bacterium GWF2_40_14]
MLSWPNVDYQYIMKNRIFKYRVGFQLVATLALGCIGAYAQENTGYAAKEESFELTDLIPESRIVVNCPKKELINSRLPTKIVFFALPNGNTIEQTAGKLTTPADDWHFDIQHIAAQTRFLMENDTKHNYIVVYLQASMKAWTSHAAKYPESPKLYTHLVDTVCSIIAAWYVPLRKQEVILSSHSGGGRFLFNYINGSEKIPSMVRGIVFIDSSYGYEDSLHADKLADWVKSSKRNTLAVFSYIDTTVVLNGKRIVSSNGGTGYRSKMMSEALINRGVKLRSSQDTTFCRFVGKGGREIKGAKVQILIKENPTGKIYHTVLVERNGFIHSLLIGSPLEEKGYRFWGERAYSTFIE